MPKIKYVGQVTSKVGKTLWEIVGNLKNYGEGRLITRGSWQRYPEPSFFKIVKLDTQGDDVSLNSFKFDSNCMCHQLIDVLLRSAKTRSQSDSMDGTNNAR